MKFNHPTLFLLIGIDSRISDMYRRLLCPPQDLRPFWQLRAQAIPQLQLVLSAMTVRCRRLALLQRVHAVGGHLLVALGDNPIASHLDKVVVPRIISLPASLPEPSCGKTQGGAVLPKPCSKKASCAPCPMFLLRKRWSVRFSASIPKASCAMRPTEPTSNSERG